MGLGVRASESTGNQPSWAQGIIAFPHPIFLTGKPRLVAVVSTSCLPRGKPISTVSGSVFPAPVSLFGDLCLGHSEGRLSRFPPQGWVGAGQPWSPVGGVAGGGAILPGAGWGFNFRGICNQWGAALGTEWLWAILGGKRLAPLGEGSWWTCSSC